jgi:phosphoglycolate phosphatase-like HAD superfamily hydrolase
MAKSEYPSVDFEKSIMVGDTDSDILFGKNLGMKTIRVLSEEPIKVEADLNVSGLEELLKIIQNEIID